MENLNNSLSELLKQHISIYQNFSDSLTRYNQLDFLTFRVKKEAFEKENPFKMGIMRDNPNREITKYENVYQLVEEDKIVLQYVREGFTPVAILQRYKVKTPSSEGRKISIYGKGLKLYYSGYIDRLVDYVNIYADYVIRADLCRDNKNPIPEGVVDLPCNLTIGEGNNRTYKGFGNKNSPLFIRIYDKTLDLKKQKNAYSYLYPARYTESCRRIEAKFTGRYAKSMTALEWLGIVPIIHEVEKQKKVKKDYLRSTFYNLIMYIDFLPNKKIQYDLLSSIRDMVLRKMKKLKDYTEIEEN